jgi:hypothetical protein
MFPLGPCGHYREQNALTASPVFATGAGKMGRHSVGTALVGGMFFSPVLNLFFIPVLYVIVQRAGDSRKTVKPESQRKSSCKRRHGGEDDGFKMSESFAVICRSRSSLTPDIAADIS